MAFTHFNDDCVKLVVVLDAGSGIVITKRTDRELLNFRVARFFKRKAMTRDYPLQVFVNHHNRLAEGVEQNRVRCFRSNTGKNQQLLPGRGCVLRGKMGNRPAMLAIEKLDEGFDGRGFALHKSRRPDKHAQLVFGNFAQAIHAEDAFGAQIRNRFLHCAP